MILTIESAEIAVSGASIRAALRHSWMVREPETMP